MKFKTLSATLMSIAALAVSANVEAAPKSPFKLRAVTPISDMPEGDFDQLATDLSSRRLYVSAEDGGAIDIFDLDSGALLRKGGDVRSPHQLVVDMRNHNLLVADGADGTVKILTPELDLVKTISVGAKPDTGIIDEEARLFYVSSLDGDESAPRSRISAISLDSLKVVRTFTIPALTLKGLILDKAGDRLFVSMRDKNRIGVVHLGDGTVESWQAEGLNRNVPLALDARHQRLFAGARQPGRLIVFDAVTGTFEQNLPLTETADSMSFDATAGRIYVSGDSGMSSYKINSEGTVQYLGTDGSIVGKTSLYVGALHRLYVMRPKQGDHVAALEMYDVK